MATIGDVLEWVRNQVVPRVRKADLDRRDPDYIRDQLPGTWPRGRGDRAIKGL